MAGVAAPTSRLAAAAVERGRRLRRRRRAATVVGAAALAAVVGRRDPARPSAATAATGRAGPASPAAPRATRCDRDIPRSAPGLVEHAGRRDGRPRSRTCFPAAPGSSPCAPAARSRATSKREWRVPRRLHRHPGQLRARRHQPPRRDAEHPGARDQAHRSGLGGRRRPRRRRQSPGPALHQLRRGPRRRASCSATSGGRRIGRLSRLDLGDVVLLTATMRMTDGGTVTIDASNSTDDKWGAGPPRAPTSRRSRSAAAGIAADPVWTSTALTHRQHRSRSPRRPAPGVLRPRRCRPSNASPSTLLTCGPPAPNDALSSRSAESSAWEARTALVNVLVPLLRSWPTEIASTTIV